NDLGPAPDRPTPGRDTGTDRATVDARHFLSAGRGVGTMQRRALALVVAAGSGPLSGLQPDAEAALTPFAGKYRFIDLALATATNSDIGPLYVAAARPSPALRAHLVRTARAGVPLRRVLAFSPGAPAHDGGRAAQLLRALAAAAPV